jgi:hypothetical protein
MNEPWHDEAMQYERDLQSVRAREAMERIGTVCAALSDAIAALGREMSRTAECIKRAFDAIPKEQMEALAPENRWRSAKRRRR